MYFFYYLAGGGRGGRGGGGGRGGRGGGRLFMLNVDMGLISNINVNGKIPKLFIFSLYHYDIFVNDELILEVLVKGDEVESVTLIFVYFSKMVFAQWGDAHSKQNFT